MFNQETGSSTNYLIIACMLISFARSFPFFRNWTFKWWRKNWRPFSLIICLHLRACLYPPFAGLNFGIRVVLIDVLLLVYLMRVKLYQTDHYESTVIILNTRLVRVKAYAPRLVSLALLEIDWKWIDLSHCLKGAPHSSWTWPSLSWRSFKAEIWCFCVLGLSLALYVGGCHTGGFSLGALVYPSNLKCLFKCLENSISSPECPAHCVF